VSFHQVLQADAGRIARRLEAALAGLGDQPVMAAMRYAVQGGKRCAVFWCWKVRGCTGLRQRLRSVLRRRWKRCMPTV